MANQWLRLWHDMPNDPKWRTISRISGQPIALVQAIYVHLLVSGSQNVTRGHADVTNEDLASHFDVTERDIDAVINAMQGRVLDGSYLTGWERRQPKKEDRGNDETGAKSAAQRKREQRERQRIQQQESNESQQCHDESRRVTTDKEEIKRREDIKPHINPTHNARAKNSVDNFSGEQFAMSDEWKPDPDFAEQSKEWGTPVEIGVRKTELTAFIDFWKCEDVMLNQYQWQQKLARHILRIRSDGA